jgi:hypothetical protein
MLFKPVGGFRTGIMHASELAWHHFLLLVWFASGSSGILRGAMVLFSCIAGGMSQAAP